MILEEVKIPVSAEQAQQLGDRLGVDWNEVPLEELRKGIEVEYEHGSKDPDTNVSNNDPMITAKIAWAHIKEFPDYYERLDKMEAEAKKFWSRG
ncbi:unnamed protein product [marine sediment metagenome]|uniref:Uncharacterized protein n=1 Tax=marine sediment metagenome TaxID=412755 RepID=X0SC88_9ZZZZ